MDITTPNNNEIAPASGEAQISAEATSIAETILDSPSAPPVSAPAVSQAPAVPEPITSAPIQDDAKLDAEELEDLTSADVEDKDESWVGKVREVIKDDEGEPYKEEEDAEALNEEYMKNRFNVDVDAPIEEK